MPTKPALLLTCDICGVEFQGRSSKSVICPSRACAIARQRKVSHINAQSLRGHIKHLLRIMVTRKGLSIPDLLNMFEAQKGMCAISGVSMTWGLAERSPNTISIDRIDSNIGYTLDNVQLVCFAVNLMKRDHSSDDFVNWCRSIVKTADSKKEQPDNAH